jgi:hypothetical protein
MERLPGEVEAEINLLRDDFNSICLMMVEILGRIDGLKYLEQSAKECTVSASIAGLAVTKAATPFRIVIERFPKNAAIKGPNDVP